MSHPAKNWADRRTPEDPALRAQSEKWMDWTISSFAVAFRDLFWGVVRTAPVQQQPQQGGGRGRGGQGQGRGRRSEAQA